MPHYVYGETGKVLTKRDITGEATDERYAAADQFLLEEGATNIRSDLGKSIGFSMLDGHEYLN